ncbi:hypothetical protein I4U23_031553 [Adineta vaga]|nr:hypothetical protein I4U23_031553 [Adineta vaga]
MTDYTTVPIGSPLPQYQCLVFDEFHQSVIVNEEGELFVGGAGVFAGYLHRDDLSAKALIYVDDELFYRTGDLVHMDGNGLLHYRGRKDHQVKVHGQRIELGEIEQCLFFISSISACVVMKWHDDYLIAYVQSSSVNEQQLRDHCQSHLPPHMIPSIFIILDRFPLNANGKIDRKSLPSSHLSPIQIHSDSELQLPTTSTEIAIHRICCDLFHQENISLHTNLFSVGAHSLLMIQLFHRYKTEFHFHSTSSLSITDLFQNPTIFHHAQAIQQNLDMSHTTDDSTWFSLHLTEAKASYAQERIFLDDHIHFSSPTNNHNMYAIPLLYRISSLNHPISFSRLHHAFQHVIAKHHILRTALHLNTNGILVQNYSHMKSCRLSMIDLHGGENESIKKIISQPNLFDLSDGHVINCHVLRSRSSTDTFDNDDLLNVNDFILFTIHHAFFDGTSTSIFIRDLSLAYSKSNTSSLTLNDDGDDETFQYIDYSVHEHLIDMTLSQRFWCSQLHGLTFHQVHPLLLVADRQRASSTINQRSGSASFVSLTFDQQSCSAFVNYASNHHLTLFQLALATFYLFLFRLSHLETDLYIATINANRYRSELQQMIGMFVSTLPCRLQLDPHWSFHELAQQVRCKCLSIFPHSHYPLQHLLADLRHVNHSNISLVETMLDFLLTDSSAVNELNLDEARLVNVSLDDSFEVAKFDFSLRFIYDPTTSKDGQLSCALTAVSDLFNESTVREIGVRFQYVFEQVFSSEEDIVMVQNGYEIPISAFEIVLPEERREVDDVLFSRQCEVINEGNNLDQ